LKLFDLSFLFAISLNLAKKGTEMNASEKKKVILDQKEMSEALKSIARQILLRHESLENICLVGIRTGGAYLAERLRQEISKDDGEKLPIGVLDINLYRDDWTRLGSNPKLGSTDIPFSTDEKIIILVDDVVFTGRTTRAAMDALIDFGRPRRIELAVLVDRGEEQRELPIKATYVAKEWETSKGDTVDVYFREAGFQDQVVIGSKVEEPA
jgi:pyrimidine operon attenuation protein/uracil phosphoribosyltransferase